MEQTDSCERAVGRNWVKEGEWMSGRTFMHYMHDSWTRTLVGGLTVGVGGWVKRGKREKVGTTVRA